MIEIDGGERSGSGTLVRVAVALAALAREPVRIRNARARRPRPGLRAQHVAAVRAAAELCGGRLEGDAVGSRTLVFAPGRRIRGGPRSIEIGTAGSATMLALGILPIACFADAPTVARIGGGVFQDHAPSPHHLAHVVAPLLRRMGVRVELVVLRAGYAPAGAGLIELRVEPVRERLAPLVLAEVGAPGPVEGVAFASHLAARRVAERMASACEADLRAGGLAASLRREEDERAAQPGASLAIWCEREGGGRLGADRAGAPRRSSEAIGRFAARALLDDLASGASVDRHAADQLVPFAALAAGTSRWRAPGPSAHLDSNLWLASLFGAAIRGRGPEVELDGISLSP
jgi:RNA 3'-terminal phosphate cyclase (ATP)